MTPADIPIQWPTADEIARAVFIAASLENEDPIDVLRGKHGACSRAYAFIALAHQYPTCPRATLGRKVGNDAVASGSRTALRHKAWSWFSIDHLNVVCAALDREPMTLDEAIDAPLIYCGRPWTEFLPPAAAPDVPPPSVGAAPDETAEAEPSTQVAALAPPAPTPKPSPPSRAAPPAERRGVVNVTAQLMGDPDPSRSALGRPAP